MSSQTSNKENFHPLRGRNILLGVTASISAYKAAYLARLFIKAGANVNTAISENALKFIGEETFRGITSNIPYSQSYFNSKSLGGEPHITLTKDAELFIAYPLTANSLVKLSTGFSDCPVSLSYLSYQGSKKDKAIFLAPAMASEMWDADSTIRHMDNLKSSGAKFIGPVSGELASGHSGTGRLEDPEKTFQIISRYFAKKYGPLKNKKIIISAGGTKERIDPVRFLGNDSSGKMGHALAEAALNYGAEVTLVSSSYLEAPYGAKVLRFESAKDLKDLIDKNSKDTDALIMAAAVSDFRPEETFQDKVKSNTETLSNIKLTKNPDIIKESSIPIKIAFAAETENFLENAKSKLKNKGADLIVLNDINQGVFGSDFNQVTLIDISRGINKLGKMSKYNVSVKILNWLVENFK